MTELRERLIAAFDEILNGGDATMTVYEATARDDLERLADAALAALRSPTPPMLDAGSGVLAFLRTPGHVSDGSAERIWQAMIGAA